MRKFRRYHGLFGSFGSQFGDQAFTKIEVGFQGFRMIEGWYPLTLSPNILTRAIQHQ
jgi:hypothetical protein